MSRKTISSMMLPNKVQLDNFNADLESQQVRVDSEILHPITSSNTGTNDFLKFVIQSKGILSPKSKIQFCLTTSTAYSTALVYYPLLIGGLSVIKSARLQIGNRTISTSDSYNQFVATQRGLVRPCKRLGIDAVTHLSNDTYNVVSQGTDGASNKGVGVYTGNLDWDGTVQDVQFNNWSALGDTASSSPTFSVSLEELFPFLSNNLDLPLYLLKPNEQVVVYLELQNDTQNGDRTICDAGNSADFSASLLDLASTKMIVDYVYFNQDRMMEIENAYKSNGDMVEYMDLQLVEQSLPNTSDGVVQTDSIILTGTNRVCKGIFCSFQYFYSQATTPKSNIMGNYFSQNLNRTRGFNLTINNQQLLVGTADKMTTAESYYYYSTWNSNIPAYIPKPLYSEEEQMTTNVCNGIANTNIEGFNSPFGIAFGESGYAINSVPIKMTLARKHAGSGLNNNRIWVWCCIRRIFSINPNGSVSVSY
jgi:hypothetical protein